MKEYCADLIALYEDRLVLIERLTDPKGYALVGGRRERIDGQLEPAIVCAEREFHEETGLECVITGLLGCYDGPNRDPRGEKGTTVYYGRAWGTPRGEPGKTIVRMVSISQVPALERQFAFDHYAILQDYLRDHYVAHTAAIGGPHEKHF